MTRDLDHQIMERVRANPGRFTVSSLAATLKVRRKAALDRIFYLMARGKLSPANDRAPLYVRETAPAFVAPSGDGNAQFGQTGGDAA